MKNNTIVILTTSEVDMQLFTMVLHSIKLWALMLCSFYFKVIFDQFICLTDDYLFVFVVSLGKQSWPENQSFCYYYSVQQSIVCQPYHFVRVYNRRSMILKFCILPMDLT